MGFLFAVFISDESEGIRGRLSFVPEPMMHCSYSPDAWMAGRGRGRGRGGEGWGVWVTQIETYTHRYMFFIIFLQ